MSIIGQCSKVFKRRVGLFSNKYLFFVYFVFAVNTQFKYTKSCLDYYYNHFFCCFSFILFFISFSFAFIFLSVFSVFSGDGTKKEKSIYLSLSSLVRARLVFFIFDWWSLLMASEMRQRSARTKLTTSLMVDKLSRTITDCE